MNKPEPLKGKIEFVSYASVQEKDFEAVNVEDIRSAVEWFLKELGIEDKEDLNWEFKGRDIKHFIDKAFEDVI